MTQLYADYKKLTSNSRDVSRLKVKGWEKICPANNQKAVEMATFITHEVDLRAKKIIRHKKGYYIIIKKSTHQEDKTILNVYTQNNRTSKQMKQKLMRAERKQTSTIISGTATSPISETKTTRQMISKDIELNTTINQQYLTNIC